MSVIGVSRQLGVCRWIEECRLRRGLSRLMIFLLLVDLRSSLGDATFYEISLNLELLLRA
jgi:hypothetical protein